MNNSIEAPASRDGCLFVAGDSERVDPLVFSTDTKLAIARACAVLSARGIEPHYQGLL